MEIGSYVRLCIAITSLLWISVSPALGQTADPFNPGCDGPVYSLALQTDGEVLVGGDFSFIANQFASSLARLTSTGDLDALWNSDAEGVVNSLALQTNSALLVGGSFTNLNGIATFGIGRLNSDGSLDTQFNPSAQTNISSIVLQPDGKILIGGDFSQFSGGTATNIARLDTQGSPDTNFNSAIVGSVYTLALQPDGKILVGGRFSLVNGQPRSNLARLNPNGSLDTNFTATASDAVYCLAPQADGKILLGGLFTILAGKPHSYLGRLNSDGSPDLNFSPLLDVVTGNRVASLALQCDGKILVGGFFNSLNGQSRVNLGRLNSDGSTDLTFAAAADHYVSTLAIQPDGKLLVGGTFLNLAGVSRPGLGRIVNTEAATQTLSFDGAKISWLRGGASPEVWRTTFAICTNGSDWFGSLVGSRATNGWQVNGLTFPSNSTIRARGFVSAGKSDWFVESLTGSAAITDQPSNQTNLIGDVVTFSVTAGGDAPLTYQWQKDAIGLTNSAAISGAFTASLTISNVALTDQGQYSVLVTNGLGSVTSRVATLTVLDPSTPPRILVNDGAFGFHTNQFGFNVRGVTTQVVVVEGSTNFVTWQPLATNTIRLDTVYFSDPAASNFVSRFYRARLQ